MRCVGFMRDFDIIVATSSNLGIGMEGYLPWKIQKDMDSFKKITTSTNNPRLKNACIMGRKTWQSLPPKYRPLPNRVNVILSADKKFRYYMLHQILASTYIT